MYIYSAAEKINSAHSYTFDESKTITLNEIKVGSRDHKINQRFQRREIIKDD